MKKKKTMEKIKKKYIYKTSFNRVYYCLNQERGKKGRNKKPISKSNKTIMTINQRTLLMFKLHDLEKERKKQEKFVQVNKYDEEYQIVQKLSPFVLLAFRRQRRKRIPSDNNNKQKKMV